MATEPLKNLKHRQHQNQSRFVWRQFFATLFALTAAVLSAFTMFAIVAPRQASAQSTATTATMTMSVLSTKRGVTTAGPAQSMPVGSFVYSRIPTEAELRTAPAGTPTVSGGVMLTVNSPNATIDHLRWFDGDNLDNPRVWIGVQGSHSVMIDTSVMPNGLNWIDLNGDGSGLSVGAAGSLFAFNVFNQFPLELRLKSPNGAWRNPDKVAWRADETLVLESTVVPLSVFTPTFQSVTVNGATVPAALSPALVTSCAAGTQLNLALATPCAPYQVNGVTQPLPTQAALQAALRLTFQQSDVWVTSSNSGFPIAFQVPSLPISVTLQNKFDQATATYEELTLNPSGRYVASGKQSPVAGAVLRGVVLIRGSIDPRFGASGSGISLNGINVNHYDVRAASDLTTMLAPTQPKPVAIARNPVPDAREQITVLDTTFLANGANELIVHGRAATLFNIPFRFSFEVSNGKAVRELQVVNGDYLRLSNDTGIATSDYEPLTWNAAGFNGPGWEARTPLWSFNCRPTAGTSEVWLGQGCASTNGSATSPLGKSRALAGEFSVGSARINTAQGTIKAESFSMYHFRY
jgi:hypothetical protein